MNKEAVLKAIKELKEKSKKRNFNQTFDLVINLKLLDIKKTPIEQFMILPHGKGKEAKICAIIDKELSTEAKNIFNKVILRDNFDSIKNNKIELKSLAEYDYIIAQDSVMPQVASILGKYLGAKGKMPNPKAGCIVTAKTPLKPLQERLSKTVKVATKNEAVLKCLVGKETMNDDEIVENVLSVYNNISHILPQEKNNVKSVLLKLTMSKPIKIE